METCFIMQMKKLRNTTYEKGIIDDPIKSLTSSMPVSRSSVVVNKVARSGVFCKLPKETPV